MLLLLLHIVLQKVLTLGYGSHRIQMALNKREKLAVRSMQRSFWILDTIRKFFFSQGHESLYIIISDNQKHC